jgi:hypothetical protein
LKEEQEKRIMNIKRNIVGLFIGVLVITQTSMAGAQTFQNAKARRGGWSEIAKKGSRIEAPADLNNRLAVQPSGFDNAEADSDVNADMNAKDGAIETQVAAEGAKIVGTWLITVPDAPGAPGFKALQTFHENGTFTETSDLLGQGVEGPAHGAWSGKKNDYRLSFQLFTFDENGNPSVRVRVRCTIRIINENSLQATTTVDIIEPDGNIITNVGGGPFSGVRLPVVPE